VQEDLMSKRCDVVAEIQPFDDRWRQRLSKTLIVTQANTAGNGAIECCKAKNT
jgi:hypothetical protein